MLKKIKILNRNAKIMLSVFLISIGVVSFIAANSVNEVKVEPSIVAGNVTLDFKDADINNVLRILSYKSGVNIVAGKEVQGLVTIRLVDVPWEKALDVVLRTYGFVYEREGNIIRVTTVENLGKETLATEVFVLNYSKAKDVSETLKEMLTERGKIRYDERENMLIVTDIPTNVYKIGLIVKKLDSRTPQVMIEAKIIETTLANNETLGINWDAKVTAAGSKVPTTFPFPREDIPGTKQSGEDSSDKYFPLSKTDDSDFPTTNATARGYSPQFPVAKLADFTFGRIDASEFQVVLQYLESRTKTTILSNPRITTLDNKEAEVNVTSVIPIPLYSYDTASGTRVISGYEEQKIGVRLRVTPRINDEEYITMTIHPEVSELTGYAGPDADRPIYDIREAIADVMVKDGETLVIGGLLKDKKSKGRAGIPFLGKVPILGLLFSQKTDTLSKTELLIFVTPRLIKETSEGARLAALELQKAETQLAPVDVKEERKKKKKKAPDNK